MRKSLIIFIVVLLVAVLTLVLVFLRSSSEPEEPETGVVLSGEDCAALNGRIVNTLAATPEESETCASNETNVGEVTGLMCPCICCVGK